MYRTLVPQEFQYSRDLSASDEPVPVVDWYQASPDTEPSVSKRPSCGTGFSSSFNSCLTIGGCGERRLLIGLLDFSEGFSYVPLGICFWPVTGRTIQITKDGETSIVCHPCFIMDSCNSHIGTCGLPIGSNIPDHQYHPSGRQTRVSHPPHPPPPFTGRDI